MPEAPDATAPDSAANSAAPAPTVATATAPNPGLPGVVLIDAYPSGVDPAAATFVTDILRQAVTSM
ncbi:MAG: hypothetical protein WCJ30_18190, partial [Deltaproteobacteria bacterium]